MDKKLTSLKMKISKLDYQEIMELKIYLRKREDVTWKVERVKRKEAHNEKIKLLPPGTKVIFNDSRDALCGEVGTIVRHLGRGSSRTEVDFGEKGIWHIPRIRLDSEVDEEKIKALKCSKNLSTVLNKALSNMEL